MRKVIYSPQAKADLRAIATYIADDNPARAHSFVDELRDIANSAAERPASFPAREDLGKGLRTARHGRYLLFFRPDTDRVTILRVLHGARDIGAIFGNEGEAN